MADLTTLENVKTYCRVGAATDDELINRIISAASEFFQTVTGRDHFDSVKSYTELRDGTGGDVLVLKHYPVQAITSLTINGQTIPESPDGLTAGYLFNPESRMLALVGYRFDRGRVNVQITYMAGYDAVPADVEDAVVQLAALRYKEYSGDRVGVQSIVLAGQTITYSQRDMPEYVATIVGKYQQKLPL